jgi:hypothetical protein
MRPEGDMRGLELLQRNDPNAHFGSGGFLI